MTEDGFPSPPAELFDLLAERAVFGLDQADDVRLDSLLEGHGWIRRDCLDETAATFAAESAADAAMPIDVRQRVHAGVHAGIEAILESEAAPEVAGRIGGADTAPARGSNLGWIGWVAAAAAIAVAVMVANPVEPLVPRNRAQLAAWIDDHPSAVHWDWSKGLGDAADEDATGLVTFDPETQQGYMLIKGLAPNDPRFEQYQLWIWDQDREPDPGNPSPLSADVHPVDGGVFDVSSEGEAVIPIRSSLVIGRPYLFAVTVERPGGVAKSGKERVPIIAKPATDA